MNTALIYKNPADFTKFMVTHLEGSLNAKLQASEDDPMKLEVLFHDARGEEKGILHLQNAYETYRRTGDLNAAIDFMNGIVEATKHSRGMNPDHMTFDADQVYPVLRPRRDIDNYNREGYKLLRYAEVPGMDTVLLERKLGFSMLLNEDMLKGSAEWDKLSIKQKAYRNLRRSGWKRPNLQLQNPLCEDCEVWVYLDPPVPMQCQLLLPELTFGRLPDQFIAAFPNKETTIIMKTTRKLESLAAVKRLVRESKFSALVERSYAVQPFPLSRYIYWISNGKPTRIIV